MFCLSNVNNPNRLISTSFASCIKEINKSYSRSIASCSEEKSLSESRIVDKLREYYTALETAIVSEEADKAINILIKMRKLPVTLSILKTSGTVKQLRALKKHASNRVCEEINMTIRVWDQRTLEAAKKGSVLIQIPESKKRNKLSTSVKPSTTSLKSEQESRNAFDRSSPNCNRDIASTPRKAEEPMSEHKHEKEQDRLWNTLV